MLDLCRMMGLALLDGKPKVILSLSLPKRRISYMYVVILSVQLSFPGDFVAVTVLYCC